MSNHSIHCRCELCRQDLMRQQCVSVPIKHPGTAEETAKNLDELVENAGRIASEAQRRRNAKAIEIVSGK